ncbi:hypothetical protein NLX86_26445 [Streptomyces sp. A3M-1-3]|uniref:hypothetical protein n=1 Tax=Streptomyces sp. A3M-1-3 TaxID=2962044 RepID=UPI0020B66D92|nr:hypothetical protein [Streptomyces sp. A3M-1-3]MCP3821504.1 hypothetical protein [Streptomyces sp. A3M-1-3]
MDSSDTESLATPDTRAVPTSNPAADAFLTTMGNYQQGVNQRYDAFLNEVGHSEVEQLHAVVLQAMISGALTGLSSWLNQRHGPRSFVSLFLSPTYPRATGGRQARQIELLPLD